MSDQCDFALRCTSVKGHPGWHRPAETTTIRAERRENPEHLRIGITNRMILGGMSGPDAKRLIDEYDAACARNDQ